LRQEADDGRQSAKKTIGNQTRDPSSHARGLDESRDESEERLDQRDKMIGNPCPDGSKGQIEHGEHDQAKQRQPKQPMRQHAVDAIRRRCHNRNWLR